MQRRLRVNFAPPGTNTAPVRRPVVFSVQPASTKLHRQHYRSPVKIVPLVRIKLPRDKAVVFKTCVRATTTEEKQQQELIARHTTQLFVLGALLVKYWTLVVLFVSNALREKRRRVLLDRVPPV